MLVYQRVLMVNWTELFFLDQGISGSPELEFLFLERRPGPLPGKQEILCADQSERYRPTIFGNVGARGRDHIWSYGYVYDMSMSQLVQFGGHMAAISTSINFLLACAFPGHHRLTPGQAPQHGAWDWADYAAISSRALETRWFWRGNGRILPSGKLT